MVPVNPEKFVSPPVDEAVRAVSARVADPRLRDLFPPPKRILARS